MSKMGHNSGTADDRLRSFVERIERLNAEKEALMADIKDVFSEVKSAGFDVKILKKIIAMRKKDKADLEEEATIIELYMNALGMLADTPLGQAAIKRRQE